LSKPNNISRTVFAYDDGSDGGLPAAISRSRSAGSL